MIKRAVPIFAVAIIAGVFAAACGDSADTGSWTTDITQAKDPSGATPLANLDQDAIRETLKGTRAGINQARPLGMKAFLAALKAELTKRGMDPAIVDRIDDGTIGKQMPGGTVATQPIKSQSSALGSSTFALGANDFAEFYDCPILAPEDNSGTACGQIVEAVVVQVKNEMKAAQDDLLGQAKETNPVAPAAGQGFIGAWFLEAYEYGIDVAAIYAAYELKAAAACDDKTNAGEVSTALGTEQGWQIVESHREWALSQVTTCAVNTDDIAEQVRTMSRNEVSTFMTQNKVCKDGDVSSQTPALQAAEVQRREGILEGIDERVEILRNELFQARTTAPCGTGGGDGGGDGGGGGDPLLIDLDGDGLELRTEHVSFDLLGDGSKQPTTWAGAREGFVAIDLDGDGAITSVAEMMGNKSDCDGRPCYDGISALAAYDSADRGGNGDGVIDEKDQAFDKLLIWVDANSDGNSEPSELSSFADRGILSVSLEATHCIQRMDGGTLAGKIQVLTKNGFRDAVDTWFQVQLKMQNLSTFLPRK